ncbi:hypothetical protein [Natrinema thermotolerans]|uniref:hypothetical protein n=1 Tax=Natrinema thermotolerans TaxID=121872 RepID=UPI000AECE7B0|nr:hypothetical protein [Natrinema thermotolerans]
MATTSRPTTDAPTLPTDWTDAWPTLERDGHDPEYLVTNDPAATEARTLADYGGVEPTDPDRPTIPTDDRQRSEQTSVFEYPREWWADADRLAHLFDERGLSIRGISELFGDDRCYEVVRSRLTDFGIRDPDEPQTGAALLASMDPEDAGLSPTTDDDHARFSKRGRSA